MKRRLYFLFADVPQVRAAVTDLIGLGIESQQMHTLARDDIDVDGLPVATDRQRRDSLAHIENGLWNGNLMLFGLAAIGMAVAGLSGYRDLALLAILVMIASVVGGAWFAIRLPHVHLDEFQPALRHGEILLMVDVSRDCVEDVETLIQRRHPDTVTGGSGWTTNLIGV